jgi:hypothetical protein
MAPIARKWWNDLDVEHVARWVRMNSAQQIIIL